MLYLAEYGRRNTGKIYIETQKTNIMQETNIKFSGLALTPYSDISPDGQLSACIGLESHGGALRPSLLAGRRYNPPEEDGTSYSLIHVHTTSAYSHFVFRSGDGLYWSEAAEGQYTPRLLDTYTGLSSVNTVGNTLVVLTSSGLHYLLWKEGEYKYIGQKPPEIGLSFGLSTTAYERDSGAGSITLVPARWDYGMTGPITLSHEDDQILYVTDIVMGAINKVMEACSQNNRFCAPFFVRAAYRRFDGTYTMLTPPVLMIPDSTGPKALFTLEESDGERLTGKVTGQAWASVLLASLPESFGSDAQSWSDIISSVDIFVSPQVFRTDTSQQVTAMYGIAPNDPLFTIQPPVSYGIGQFSGTFDRVDFDWKTADTEKKHFEVPLKNEEAFLQELNGSTQFYKVRSIPLSQISSLADGTFFSVLERRVDFLNIVQQESLPDSADYQSHDTLVSRRSHVYNQRLHLFDVERILFAGFLPETSWAYTNTGLGGEIKVYVQIASEDGNVRTVSTSSSGYRFSHLGRFLYYPDPNANRMFIAGGGFYYDIPLQPHPLLGGAYYLFMDTPPAISQGSQPEASSSPVKTSNKVYTSEVGNPFYFPLEGIYTVGTGQILALSSVATALSQGQFGQFPLMIFCSDGNYAMSVNEEGRYSAIHPMQRDVCTNPDSITQTDSEVLFVTSRGVMVTSGASAQSISLLLDGVPEVIPGELPFTNPSVNPVEFFKSCRVVYDYTNRRIVFFSPGEELQYVYSIEEQSWSSASFGIMASVINQFPYSYVQMADGTIVLLSESYPYGGNPVHGLIYTRPVKMDTFALKKLLRVSLQGVFSRVQNILIYASNDGNTWHFLGRSASSSITGLSGRTFKYYRFAVETELDPSENISALRIQFEPRAERRFR